MVLLTADSGEELLALLRAAVDDLPPVSETGDEATSESSPSWPAGLSVAETTKSRRPRIILSVENHNSIKMSCKTCVFPHETYHQTIPKVMENFVIYTVTYISLKPTCKEVVTSTLQVILNVNTCSCIAVNGSTFINVFAANGVRARTTLSLPLQPVTFATG